jgi:triosephosphate isomerase (TIM)
MQRRSYFFGNFKMNLLRPQVAGYAATFESLFKARLAEQLERPLQTTTVGIAAPYLYIAQLSAALESLSQNVICGAQNAHWLDSGAHTGEISLPMLNEVGVRFVIVGHSERRQYYGETDETVRLKLAAVLRHNLTAVLCIGESKEQFENGETENVVRSQIERATSGLTAEQLAQVVIAYEPVWAIGTGIAATPEIAQSVHHQIRVTVAKLFGEDVAGKIAIIYGGSTTPENIESLTSMPDIDGALPGGSSLKPDLFLALIENGVAGIRKKAKS